jgi:hypothetical protein
LELGAEQILFSCAGVHSRASMHARKERFCTTKRSNPRTTKRSNTTWSLRASCSALSAALADRRASSSCFCLSATTCKVQGLGFRVQRCCSSCFRLSATTCKVQGLSIGACGCHQTFVLSSLCSRMLEIDAIPSSAALLAPSLSTTNLLTVACEPRFRVQGSGFRVQGSGFRVQG